VLILCKCGEDLVVKQLRVDELAGRGDGSRPPKIWAVSSKDFWQRDEPGPGPGPESKPGPGPGPGPVAVAEVSLPVGARARVSSSRGRALMRS
jgi:hypothetical protein